MGWSEWAIDTQSDRIPQIRIGERQQSKSWSWGMAQKSHGHRLIGYTQKEQLVRGMSICSVSGWTRNCPSSTCFWLTLIIFNICFNHPILVPPNYKLSQNKRTNTVMWAWTIITTDLGMVNIPPIELGMTGGWFRKLVYYPHYKANLGWVYRYRPLINSPKLSFYICSWDFARGGLYFRQNIGQPKSGTHANLIGLGGRKKLCWSGGCRKNEKYWPSLDNGCDPKSNMPQNGNVYEKKNNMFWYVPTVQWNTFLWHPASHRQHCPSHSQDTPTSSGQVQTLRSLCGQYIGRYYYLCKHNMFVYFTMYIIYIYIIHSYMHTNITYSM